MSTSTRYVLLSSPAKNSLEFEIEGVFLEKDAALRYLGELHINLGIPRAQLEVEGWRGRDFVGAWDSTGRLIEDRKGRAVREEDTK